MYFCPSVCHLFDFRRGCVVDSDYPLLLKVAWYYYIENYTQQQISSMTGVSRAKVVRLLEEARSEGIIQFSFRADDGTRMATEHALAEHFGLDDVFLIPTPADPADLSISLAKAAAMYVSYHLPEDGYLNIGYGDMMGHLLNHLASARKGPLNVVSLTGGVGYYLPKVSSSLYDMRLFLIPSPLVVSTPELRDALLAEPSVQHIYDMAGYADMSVMGIGGMNETATVVRNGVVSIDEMALLSRQGAVGDMLNHFYDADGKILETEVESRVISTDLETIKNMKNVVAAAGGPAKLAAIHAVLKYGYIDVLVTDEETALALLEVDKA